MINLKNISVYFNKNTNAEYLALKNVSLNVVEGQYVTVIGGNGAGKSTLMDVLSGYTKQNEGSIFIGNKEITTLSPIERSGVIARVFQDPRIGTFSELTIAENMSIAARRGKVSLFKNAINNLLKKYFQEILVELNMNLENRLDDKVGSLSGGQRQALSLIMATLVSTEILLLDEHTAALDPQTAEIIMGITDKIIRKNNLTVLMVTHNMHHALQYGDRTIMLKQGEIILDICGEIRKNTLPIDLIQNF